MTDIQTQIQHAKEKLLTLTNEMENIKHIKRNGSLKQSAVKSREKLHTIKQLICARTLMGHSDNVTSIEWSSQEGIFVSAGKDGQLIVWNGINKSRIQTIKHKTQWLMTCAYECSANRLVATGGADRVCSVFIVGQVGMTHPSAELKGHDGYLSSCKFLGVNNIVTASGDSSATVWDITRVQAKHSFTEHAADCLDVATHPSQQSFATASADCTVKLWDVNSGSCTHTFHGHESDVNSVAYFPDGVAVGTASTDSTCKVFDTRSYGEVASFESDDSQVPASSVCFSRSGRLMFVGYSDGSCKAWDTTSPTSSPSFVLTEHTGDVTSVGLSASGAALCTASADRTIKIWS